MSKQRSYLLSFLSQIIWYAGFSLNCGVKSKSRKEQAINRGLGTGKQGLTN
jgi:hypothetical protein